MKLQLEINSNIANAHHLKRNCGEGKMGNSHGMAILHGASNNNFNNQINTITNNKIGGRVSFSGANPEQVLTFADKVVRNKLFAGFCDFAQKNSAVAEAVGALFITCLMRPAAIMAMPQKDVDKNRKAASHSIASGVTGLVFAKIAYEPFSAAMKKIKEDLQNIKDGKAGKYLGKGTEYLLENDVVRTKKGGVIKKVSNLDCFNQLVTYGPKVVTASILAAFTVGTMPYIDKYIIDKYILKNKPKEDDKLIFTTYDHFKFVTFKSKQSRQDLLQNFKGATKQ